MPGLLIAGPPCGGKSTLARAVGGRIVDYDDIRYELGGGRYGSDPAIEAEAYLLWRARIPTADVVVWTAPRRIDRGRFRTEHRARSVVCLAAIDVCLARARAERPPIWEARVRSWFDEYEPSTSGSDAIVRTDA